MAYPQLSFANIYKSRNGFRPKAQCTQFSIPHGPNDVIFWLSIGLVSDDNYMDDGNGDRGTLYPTAGASHTSGNWRDMNVATTNSYTNNLPRIAVGQSGFATGLVANTLYEIRLWLKVTNDEISTYYRCNQQVRTSNSQTISFGNASSTFSASLMGTSMSMDTNGNSVSLAMQHKPLNTDSFDSTSTTVNLSGTGSFVSIGNYQFTSAFNGSPLQNRHYWRYKAINLVTNGSFPSGYELAFSGRTSPVYLEEAFSINSNAFQIKAKTTPLEMADGTLIVEISSSANMSSPSTIGTEIITAVEGLSGLEQSVTALAISLTQDTTYYVRATVSQTGISGAFTDPKTSAIKPVKTGILRNAVKTPGEYGVGYFFKGNFSAYRKLRQQDKPEFSPSWKCSSIINGVAYLGNVKYKDKFEAVHIKPDRILKSLPNSVDTFTKYNYIDVATEDGDDITALASIGERLVEFKKNSMYVINVGGDFDFLESSYKGIGITGAYAISEFPQGIVFVNTQGAYVFNGQDIVNLLEREGKHIISKDSWSSFATPYASVGYIQEKNMFIFIDDCSSTSSGNAYLFDLDSGGWIYYKGGLPSGQKTNIIYDNSGRMLFANSSSGIYYYPQIKNGGNDEFVWQSGQLDFGDPTSMKKIYEITVSYENYGMQSQPLLYWSSDGGRTWNNPHDGSFYNHPKNSGWHNASFRLTSTSVVEYRYPTVQSLMIKLETYQIAEGFTNFKLNEINIEYRTLSKRLSASSLNTTTDTTGITEEHSVGAGQKLADGSGGFAQ